MRVFRSILIAVAVLIGAVVLSLVINVVSPPSPGSSGWTAGVVWLAILGTSLWASISSSRLEFRRYKTSMAYHPVTIFLVHLLCWIIVFPWFLTVRSRILDGTAEVKDEFKRTPYAVPSSTRPFSQGPSARPVVEGHEPQGVPDLVPPPLPVTMKRQPAPSVAPVAAPVNPSSDEDRMARLQQLADFKAQGILTDEEFQAEKRRLLS